MKKAVEPCRLLRGSLLLLRSTPLPSILRRFLCFPSRLSYPAFDL
ncbi:hypothetical protein MUK42_06665 [Musa troglodytarum]|uniref:Uncharacterized protein n=1 Tax=Musa troglodytarum TaxID=320322 RepID=A0A9E7KYD1_9LILI|nr:hypothetical protein MUK42_06665 [Musa troglodytarum]